MSKTFYVLAAGARRPVGIIVITALLLALLLPLLYVHADTRDRTARDRGDDRNADTTSEPDTGGQEQDIVPPTNYTGGITSIADGDANSGDNSGGDVTTGDESVEVVVVNIGPTNNTGDDEDETAGGEEEVSAPQEETCNSRTARNCGADGAARAR